MSQPLKSAIFIVIGLVVSVLITWIANSTLATDYSPEPTATSTPTTNTGVAEKTYTRTQISAHNSEQSCWTAVNGSVYDLTAWIANHPGGKEAILGLCGKDGSEAFNKQHNDQENPNNALASFRIGALAK